MRELVDVPGPLTGIAESADPPSSDELVHRASVGLRRRGWLLVVALAVGTVALVATWDDVAYFRETEADIVDLGDIRTQVLGADPDAAHTRLATRRHNAWLRFDNGVPTHVTRAADGASYYYDPILSMLVVTHRSLPERAPRPLPERGLGAFLLVTGQIEPGDLSSSFSAEGRLLRASRAPRFYSEVVALYRRQLQLDVRGDAGELWLFIDGQTPDRVRTSVLIAALAVALMGVAFGFWLRAWRHLRRARALA